MLLRPFRALAHCVSNRSFNLPKHLLAARADRNAKGFHGFRLPRKRCQARKCRDFRLQAAPGSQHVGDAFRSQPPQGIFIIACYGGICKDVGKFRRMFRKIIFRDLLSGLMKLLHHGSLRAFAICISQRRRYRRSIFRIQRPKERLPGITPAPGVRYIKHIPKLHPVRCRTEQGNSFAASPHITVHGVVPKIVARAGRRIGPLGVNEQLLMVRIFVEPCRRGQKARPLLRIARNLTCHSFCQLLIINHFPGHGSPPS